DVPPSTAHTFRCQRGNALSFGRTAGFPKSLFLGGCRGGGKNGAQGTPLSRAYLRHGAEAVCFDIRLQGICQKSLRSRTPIAVSLCFPALLRSLSLVVRTGDP